MNTSKDSMKGVTMSRVNLQYITQSPKVYDGDSFKEPEFMAFCATAQLHTSIHLSCKDIDIVRGRILHLSSKHNVVVHTNKVNEEVLKFTFTGQLFTKKPVRVHRKQKERYAFA